MQHYPFDFLIRLSVRLTKYFCLLDYLSAPLFLSSPLSLPHSLSLSVSVSVCPSVSLPLFLSLNHERTLSLTITDTNIGRLVWAAAHMHWHIRKCIYSLIADALSADGF